MVELRAELDQLEHDEELEFGSGDDLDEPRPCPWCGLMVSDDPFVAARNVVSFSLKEYWGPLEFDESDRERWRVALFIADAWRWLDLIRPIEPGGPYSVSEYLCSADCCEAFMRALHRDTAARRPQ